MVVEWVTKVDEVVALTTLISLSRTSKESTALTTTDSILIALVVVVNLDGRLRSVHCPCVHTSTPTDQLKRYELEARVVENGLANGS